MARRFSDHVQSFGDLRTSSIEMSHLSTLIAHETGLYGDGNVMFYFGNSAAEFDKVLIESNMKGEHVERMRAEFSNLGKNPAMFSDVEFEGGGIKRLIAINSDAYRPTSGRHEIAHMLFRTVAEANGDMDHVYTNDPITGQKKSLGKIFSPRYLSSIFGASKDLGVMPDAGWDAAIQHYTALQAYQHYSSLKDPNAMQKAQEYGASHKGVVEDFRKLVSSGTLDVRGNLDHFALAKAMSTVADEAFAYYHAATSNVFAVDKYVKDPAHRNMLRAWAENRAASNNSRIISDLELAGIELRGKFTHKDGSIRLFDDEGNPAMETSAYDDGKVVRLPAMDTWIESVMRSAYTRGEVSVSSLDPMRQAALAKSSGKEHLFNAVAGGGMRLKTKQELDELSLNQSKKIIGAISNLPENIRPLVQVGSDGTSRLFLENINNEGLEAIRQSGSFTDREFNELAGMIHIARQGAQGNPVFNVMNCTLLGATHQIRRGAAVFRLRGDDVPVTYRTFVPISVEVYFKDKDAEGNPLRTPTGAVVVHSLDVAAENRRLTKMFKRGDVQQLWGSNFDNFVKSYQEYVINQSGLNGPRVPSADLFRPQFGSDAERVRDILYETFGGRKPKDAPFINTPGNGYLGGADDPNRPFYTMRFDTMSDVRMHPTSWNARSRLPLFPYVPSAYEGITRNMMYSGFQTMPLAGGKSFLRDRNGFEIYQGDKGFNLFDMYGIKVGTFKSIKSAIDKVSKDMSDYDPADLQPAQEGHTVEINGVEETLLFPQSPAFQLKGLHERAQQIVHQGSKYPGYSISSAVISAIAAAEVKIDLNGNMTDKNGNPINEKLWASKGITAKLNDVAPGGEFGEHVRIGIGKSALTTEIEGTAQNEAVRISPEWVRALHAISGGKDIADRQIALRLATSERISKGFRDGKIAMPSTNSRAAAHNFLLIADAMSERTADFDKVEAGFDSWIGSQGAEINEHFVKRIDEVFGISNPGSSGLMPFAGKNQRNSHTFTERQMIAAFGVQINPLMLRSVGAQVPEIAMAMGPAYEEIAKQHSIQSGEAIKPFVIEAKSSAEYKQLLAAGGTPNEWMLHHEMITPGFTDAYHKLISHVDNSGTKPVGLKFSSPIVHGLVADYIASAKSAASKDGPYRKTISSVVNKDGKIVKNSSGKRDGVLYTAMVNVADPDMSAFLSQEALFRAVSVASDPANYTFAGADRAGDMAKIQMLIHVLQSDDNRYHHEIKTTSERNVAVRGTRELTGGNIPAFGNYGTYSTAPSPTRIPGPVGGAGAGKRNVVILNNVNHYSPGRFSDIAATRGSMLKDGMLTVVSGDPGSSATMSRADAISYVVSTAEDTRMSRGPEGLITIPPSKNTELVGGAQAPGDTFHNPGSRSISPAALAMAMRTRNASGIPNMARAANDAGYAWLRRYMSKEDVAYIKKAVVDDLSADFVASQGQVSVGDPVKLAPKMAALTEMLSGIMPEEKVQFAEDIIVGMAINDAALNGGKTSMLPVKGAKLGKAAQDLARADAISGMAKIHQAIQHSTFLDMDSTSALKTREKWLDMSRRAKAFMRDGMMELTTKEIGIGTKFENTNYMLTGRRAIERLDADRRDIMRDLGLLGKARDVLGNDFDYLEISDSRSKLLMDRFGGRVAMIAAEGLDRPDDFISAATAELASGVFDGPACAKLVEHANSKGLRLKDIFSHDELFALYPGMRDSRVTFDNGTFGAAYYGSENFGHIQLDVSLLLRDELADHAESAGIQSEYTGQFVDFKGKGGLTYEENLRRTLIHEVQHMVYHAEGWAEIWDWNLRDRDNGTFDKEFMPFAGPAALTRLEQMLGGSEITPVTASLGADIDEMFVHKLRHMQHETSRILSYDGSSKSIRTADETTATEAIERIIHAPIAEKMVRNVIPETMRWAQALDGTYHMMAMALNSRKAELSPEVYNSAMEKLNRSNSAVAEIRAKIGLIDAAIKSGNLDPKVGALQLLRDVDNNRKFMTIEDPSWSVLFDKSAPGFEHNLRTMSFRGKARVWHKLLDAHEDLGKNGGRMSGGLAQWHMVKIADAMGAMMYFAQPDEITARATESRASMTPSELSRSKRHLASADKDLTVAYQVGKYIGDVANNPTHAIPFDDNLFMIGGAIGSEEFDAHMFGGGTPNTFRLGMRMMARSALLSHYINVRDVGGAMKLVTFSSRGWRIGADGKAEFVFSMGSMKGAEGWGKEMTGGTKLASVINRTVEIYRDQERRDSGRVMEYTTTDENLAMGEDFWKVSKDTIRKNNALDDLIRDNSFVNPIDQDADHAIGFGLLAGLSKDGVSVGIEEVAKALGASISVDSLVTMRSPVLNAIHEGRVPLVMTGGSIVDHMRLAGVGEDGIELAKLRQIDKNFKDVSLTAGELAEIVAVMHDVPFESVLEAPLGAKHILIDAAKRDPEFKEKFKQSYRGSAANATLSARMSVFINEVISNGNSTTSSPLRSALTADTIQKSGSGIMFLQDMLETQIKLSWNGHEYLSKLMGDERFTRFKQGFLDPNNRETVFKHVMTLANGQGSAIRKASEMVLQTYCARVEKLLIELTPLADKVAQHIIKNAEADGSYHIDLLADIYRESLKSALEDITSMSFSDYELPDGEAAYSVRRSLDVRAGMGSNEPSAIGSAYQKVAANSLGMTLPRANNSLLLPAFGMIGGATDAFARTSSARARYLGTAGMSTAPVEGLDTVSDRFSMRRSRELVRGAKMSAGPSFSGPLDLNIFGQDITLTPGEIGGHVAIRPEVIYDGIGSDLATRNANSRPGNISQTITQQGLDPAIAATIDSANRLVSMGRNVLAVIEAQSTLHNVEMVASAIYESNHLGGTGPNRIAQNIRANPDIVRVMAVGDLSSDLLKAKAFIATGFEVADRPDMNVAFANFGITPGPVSRWGYYGSGSSEISITSGAYRPLSQTSLVRTHVTPDGRVVLTSAFEALADSRQPKEVGVVDAITGNGAVGRHEIAHKPTMIMIDGWHRSLNLFADNEFASGVTSFDDAHNADLRVTSMGNRVKSVSEIGLQVVKNLPDLMAPSTGFIKEMMNVWGKNWFPRHLIETMTGETIMDVTLGRLKANGEHEIHNAVDRILTDNAFFGGAARALQGDKGAFAGAYAKYVWVASAMLNIRHFMEGIKEPHRSALIEMIKRGASVETISDHLASSPHSGFKDSMGRLSTGMSHMELAQTYSLAGNLLIKDKLLPIIEASGVLNEAMMEKLKRHIDHTTAFDPTTVGDTRLSGRVIDGLERASGGRDLTGGYSTASQQLGVTANFKHGFINNYSLGDHGDGTLAVISIMSGLAKLEGKKPKFKLETSDGVKFTFPELGGTERGGATDGFIGSYDPSSFYSSTSDTTGNAGLITGGEYTFGTGRRPHALGKGSEMNKDATARYYVRNAGAGVISYESVSPENGGALAAMLDVPKFGDFTYTETSGGPMKILATRSGRSPLSSSVVRAAMVESIISELRKSNQKTIDIAPAGHHLSYVGADPMMLASATGSSTNKDVTSSWNNKGLKGINRTMQGAYRHGDNISGLEPATIISSEISTSENGGKSSGMGMGKLTGPDQISEFAPKKGYAWQRLPDGRIMINVTGDHLGYKLDHKQLTRRRPGYGFSLVEGLGWDQQNGVLIPMRINAHVGLADMLKAMEHPMAGMFNHMDAGLVGQHLRAAMLGDRRNFHETRGTYSPAKLPMAIGGNIVTSVNKTFEDVSAHLQDNSVGLEHRAEVAAQLNGHQSANGYASMILPANATPSQIRDAIVALHMEPILGSVLNHVSNQPRKYSHLELTGDYAYQSGRTLPTRAGAAPAKSGIRLVHRGSMPGSLPDEVVKALMDTTMMMSPMLLDDIDSLIGKISGGESGYFLPDTERVLSMNGDTGLAIASMFPGRPDLLRYSWDAKNMHGIKVWKRTVPKGAEGYHAHVVQFEQPTQFDAENGIKIGPRAIAFKTPEEANAFANRVSASRSGADIARALAAGELEVVDGPEMPNSPFMPDPKVTRATFINGTEAAPMRNGAYTVGDMDTLLDQKSARALGRSLGSNKHLRFAPGERLMMIGGKSMDELQDIVRSKINFGSPRGTVEFASKAMNAIISGVLPNGSKVEAMTGEDWFKVMKKAGVSGEEIRQTGLGALFINAKDNKLTRMDVAEFLAATIPMLRRHDLGTSSDLRLSAILAMGGGLEGGDSEHRLSGGYMMPYMPDSMLQTRMNQHQAISGIIGGLEKLELTHRKLVEASDAKSDSTAAAIAATHKVLTVFAEKMGMDMSEYGSKGASELALIVQKKIEELARDPHSGKDTFANLNYTGLENVRMTMNEHISNLRAMNDVSALVGAVMPEMVLPLRQMYSDFMRGSKAMEMPAQMGRATAGSSPYSWSSSTASIGLENVTGQALDFSYGKYWGGYTSGNQHVQTHAVVRFADKYATEQIDGYLTQLRAATLAEMQKDSPDGALIARNEVLEATAKRVLTVRKTLRKVMESHGSTGHFGEKLPGNHQTLGGASGAHEIGHSRFSQSLSVSGLAIEGFQDPLGFSGSLYSAGRDYSLVPLAYPITLLEEIQSDFAQKIEGVGVDKNMDIYLPLSPEEEASLALVPQYEEAVEKAASLRALANDVSSFITGKLVESMMAPRGGRSSGIGSVAALNLFLRLQLDQTDILNKGILAVQVPGILKATGRNVRAPESLKASLKGKFGLDMPDTVPSLEFDHDLIAMLAEYQNTSFTSMPDNVAELIRQRMHENINSTAEWNDSFGRKIGGGGTAATLRALGENPHRSFDAIKKNLQQIMSRGQQQMAEQHAVLKSISDQMRAAGDKSDMAAFIESLARIAEESSGDLGRQIGCELAGMAILDEDIAMNIAGYARGEHSFDYEAIARRSLERIRAKYTDTRTFTGKTILLAYEEMLKTPAEERPFMSVKENLAFPKEHEPTSNLITDLASTLRQSGVSEAQAADALLNGPLNNFPESIRGNIDDIADHLGQGGCLYVQNANGVGIMSEGGKRTFRVFRSLEEGDHKKAAFRLVNFVLERAASGHEIGNLAAFDAHYNRHNGSLAGDFVKQVIEVYAGMSRRAEFAVEAEALEAQARELKKSVPEMGSWTEGRVVPATLPYAGENSYKGMQLQMAVVDSINRGQRGVGIMDASWQLTRGHGLSAEATLGVGIGKDRRVVLWRSGHVPAIQTIMACYERLTGISPSDPNGPHNGFLHRLGSMDDAEANAMIIGNGIDHQGQMSPLQGHLIYALREMLDKISGSISSESLASLKQGLDDFKSSERQFAGHVKQHGQQGPAFIGGKKNINHETWKTNHKFVANGLKDASLITLPEHTGMGGWGYITNYGLPQHKADIMMAGTSKKFRMEYSLDAFDRPVLAVEGSKMNMLDSKTGKLIMSVDVSDAAQMKMFRERYLQSSKYVGGNWMVRNFLKEWAPTGGYIDLTVPGSHATNMSSLDSFAWAHSIESATTDDASLLASIKRKYASDRAATVLEPGHQLFTNEYAASEVAIEDAGGVTNGGVMAPPGQFTFAGEKQSMRRPESTTVNPLHPNDGRGRSPAGTPSNEDHVRALVAAFAAFGVEPGPDQVAAFTARMRHPVVTTMVHTPEARTKEMDAVFRRKMTEGVFLLMAAGEIPKEGQISQTGFSSLMATVKNRELMPITYAKNVLVDRLELPPLEPALTPAPRSKEDTRRLDFDRNKAVALMKQGYPDTQIASHLGVSRVGILNLRKNAGVAPLEEGAPRGNTNSKGHQNAKKKTTLPKRNASKPDGSNPMPSDSLSDPQHPNQIRPTESSPKSNMAKRENMEREMNE
jgi:hypothetical protein